MEGLRVGLAGVGGEVGLGEVLERRGARIVWAPTRSGDESTPPAGTLEGQGSPPPTGTPEHPVTRLDPRMARRLLRSATGGDLDVVVAVTPDAAGELVALARAQNLAGGLTEAACSGRLALAALCPATATALERAGLPVSLMPKSARADALARMLDAWAATRHTLPPPRIQLLPDSRAARIGRQVHVFGELEFGVLAALVRRPDVACSHSLIAREAWEGHGPDSPAPVKHHISRIRDKLGPAAPAIQTVRGVGYRYAPSALPADGLSSP